MTPPHTGATWADYRAAVSRFIEALDRALEEGKAAERRYEAFCQRHGIVPGIGRERLTSESLPPAQRQLHARLLDLTQQLYDSELGPSAPERTSFAPAANRALSSRNRI